MESIHSRSLVTARSRARRPQGGFTLVEMLVTLGIIAVITSVTVLGQSSFNQTILLTDTAYTVALSAREAQSLGLSSRKFSNVQNAGYGLHFDNGDKKKYLIFADIVGYAQGGAHSPNYPIGCPIPDTATSTPEAKTGNCLFDDTSETYQTYSMTRGFTISDICAKNSGGSRVCASTGDLTTLDVLFLRPNTQAIITTTLGTARTSYSCAEVSVLPPTSSIPAVVRMSQTGEISVGQTCP